MQQPHILTDSMCHIPAGLRQELEIDVIPLPFVWDGASFLDDQVEPREFFSRLRTAKTLPTTSNPTPGTFKDRYEKLGADGRPVLVITLGADLSHTFEAANLAKEMAPKVEVAVFNSGTHSMALGYQVLAAARSARKGMGMPEILSMLETLRSNTGVVFAVRDITYLQRGGRISHLQSLLGQALGLIPIMELRGGPIRLAERVRNWSAVAPKLLATASEHLGNNSPRRLAVIHADAEREAWQLEQEARAGLAPDELYMVEVSPVLGVHIGPGSLGLAFSFGV
jgi:DegV family protein with EDD domain